MYMLGRFRTASRPSKTVMDDALYSRNESDSSSLAAFLGIIGEGLASGLKEKVFSTMRSDPGKATSYLEMLETPQ
jgi:hypothetical protein